MIEEPQSGHGNAGFTLVELMVTIAVLVVLVLVAVPGMRSLTESNQMSATKSAFMSAVALARTEAARAGTQVVLQAESGGSPGNDFAKGWRLQLNDDAKTVVRVYEALPGALTLRGDPSVTFAPTGYITPATEHVYKLCRTSGDGFRLLLPPSGIADVQTCDSACCAS